MSQAGRPFGDYLVVITGAGNGIGRATALGFADELDEWARQATADVAAAAKG